MNHYLLIWDIDGTLIRTRGAGRRAMDMAFLELYGIEEGFKDIEMAGMLDPIILKNALVLHRLEGKDSREFFDCYCSYLEQEMKKLTEPIVIPGVLGLLEVLHGHESFYNVLGTGNIERGARIKLSPDGMNKFFPAGGFSDECTERWQVIEKAFINARQYFGGEFEGSGTYVIGDTPRDIACGQKLNFKTVGVATGGYACEQLLGCGADHVFADFTDVKAFLNIFGL